MISGKLNWDYIDYRTLKDAQACYDLTTTGGKSDISVKIWE
jgi:hypothetical protein